LSVTTKLKLIKTLLHYESQDTYLSQERSVVCLLHN